MKRLFLAIIFTLAAGPFFQLLDLQSGTVAEAAIRCSGPYQVIRGIGKHATPYCEDSYLARVARGYGVRVSGHTIRHNPHLNSYNRQFIGHDSRVYDICTGLRDDDSGGNH